MKIKSSISKTKSKGHFKLTDMQIEALLRGFVNEESATAAAQVAGVNQRTGRLFYQKCRQVIHTSIKSGIEQYSDPQHSTESRFQVPDDWRVKGMHPLVALFTEQGRTYSETLGAIRKPDFWPRSFDRRLRKPDCIVHIPRHITSERLLLEDVKSVGEAASAHHALTGWENFMHTLYGMAGRYKSIPLEQIPFYLKEAEFRCNYGSPQEQIRTLTRWIRQAKGVRGQS